MKPFRRRGWPVLLPVSSLLLGLFWVAGAPSWPGTQAQEPPPSPSPPPAPPEEEGPPPAPPEEESPPPSPEGEPGAAPSPAPELKASTRSPDLRFFALGDTGTGSPDQFKVGKALAEKCRASRCDFGVLLGDNFYMDGVESATDPQWKHKFEEPYAELLSAGVPFYAVLGNHDYADGRDFSRGAHQVAYGRINGLWIMPDEFYSFEQGDALFLALNTQFIVSNRKEAETVQAQYFRDVLAAASKPWIIALGHHPYISNGTNGDAPRPLARFVDDLLCKKADLYLAGHDHNLQVLKAPSRCGTLFVVSGGGGYATYALSERNPAHFQARALGFAYVVVEPKGLTLEVLDAEGRLLFSHSLTK